MRQHGWGGYSANHQEYSAASGSGSSSNWWDWSKMANELKTLEKSYLGLNPQIVSEPTLSHCDINSWNIALGLGLDPRAPGGICCDGNLLNVAQIYEYYKNAVTDHPVTGTAGYGFYDDNKDGVPNHMFDYSYDGGKTYGVWNSAGITSPVYQTWTYNGDSDAHSTFYALPLF
jgi:hypothetical protein